MTTIHLWNHDDGQYGVNAWQDGVWLPHDDLFYSYKAAREYADRLLRELGATRLIEWPSEPTLYEGE